MKKSYLMIAFAALTFGANAQNRGDVQSHSARPFNGTPKLTVLPTTGARASGDTLMYMPLPGYSVNTADAPNFQVVTEDLDGYATYNAGYAMDFGVYYSTDSSLATGGEPTQDNFFHPWETPAPVGTDSAFFWSATSWFASPNTADNWLMIGPLTIPAGGATLVWYDRTNRYRDGYQVLVSDGSIASTPLTFSDFDLGTPIFTETDDAYPSATWAVDTTWELKTAVVPASFNGMTAVFAFHHNADDMDVLRLDEITLVDGSLATGIVENTTAGGIKVYQNMPNPFGNASVINYELAENANVILSVYDVTGKKVAEKAEGRQAAGVHNIQFNASDLSAGVYYYSLQADNNTTAAMKMVVIK